MTKDVRIDGCKAVLTLVRKLKDSWLSMGEKPKTQRPLQGKTKFYVDISSHN